MGKAIVHEETTADSCRMCVESGDSCVAVLSDGLVDGMSTSGLISHLTRDRGAALMPVRFALEGRSESNDCLVGPLGAKELQSDR